jgi:hypothetical protein
MSSEQEPLAFARALEAIPESEDLIRASLGPAPDCAVQIAANCTVDPTERATLAHFVCPLCLSVGSTQCVDLGVRALKPC